MEVTEAQLKAHVDIFCGVLTAMLKVPDIRAYDVIAVCHGYLSDDSPISEALLHDRSGQWERFMKIVTDILALFKEAYDLPIDVESIVA